MRLHLIRHTTPDVPAGVCYGQSDVPLASSFATEAEEVRKRLCTLLEGNVPSRVYSSPLSRCLLLAEACGYPDALRDDRLMELNFGAWELQRFDTIEDPQLERWYADYLYEAPTGGESFHSQVLRVSSFLDDLRAEVQKVSVENEDSPMGEVLVFTHGGVLLGAGIWAGLFSIEEAFDHRVPYGGILTLEI